MKIKQLIITAISFAALSGTANAQWVVTDPGHTIVNTIKSVKDGVFQAWNQISDEYNWAIQHYNDAQRYINQITEIQNQYNQIEQMATALHGIDPNSFNTLKSSLQNTFHQSNNLFSRLRGMNDNIESIEAKFEKSYPTLEAMAKLDPVGWKAVVNTSAKEQVDNIYNAKLKAANIKKMNEEMQAKLESLSDQNNSVTGIKETAQLGNQIALQQQQLALAQNENLALMLKQNADNINNMLMVQQAMQLEASKTFKYTPQAVTTDGPGLYHIK